VTIDQCKKDIADTKLYLQQLENDRKTFGDAFKQRLATRNDEMAATQAALDALQAVSSSAKDAVEGGGASFLQVTSSRPIAGRIARAATILHVTGEHLASVSLVQVASRMRMHARARAGAHVQVGAEETEDDVSQDEEPGFMDSEQQDFHDASKFDPVVKLLTDLIGRLEEALNAETTQHDWCEKEKDTSVAAKGVRETAIKELKGTIESLSTEIDQLKEQITFHMSEIKRINKETATAKKLRAKEHKVFLKAKADHEEVIGAIRAALGALGGQYSFLQVEQVPGQQNVFQDYQSGAGGAGSAMEMLQDLESRYSKALSELTADENAAQADHDALLKTNAQLVTDNTNDMNAKMSERREKLGLLGTDKADMKTNLIELHEVNTYLKDLRPSCDDIRSTFEERKKRREAEISALKEALEVIQDPTGAGGGDGDDE